MKTLIERWQAPVNKFWKKAINLFMSMLVASGTGYALAAGLEKEIGKELPSAIYKILEYMALIGFAGSVLSKLTVADPSQLNSENK